MTERTPSLTAGAMTVKLFVTILTVVTLREVEVEDTGDMKYDDGDGDFISEAADCPLVMTSVCVHHTWCDSRPLCLVKQSDSLTV